MIHYLHSHSYGPTDICVYVRNFVCTCIYVVAWTYLLFFHAQEHWKISCQVVRAIVGNEGMALEWGRWRKEQNGKETISPWYNILFTHCAGMENNLACSLVITWFYFIFSNSHFIEHKSFMIVIYNPIHKHCALTNIYIHYNVINLLMT